MKELQGVIALVPTPLTTEGKLDEIGLRNLIDFDLANGCDGVGVLAAIGEGYLFNAEETEKVVRVAAAAMGGRGPLIVGCPAMGTIAAVESSRRAQDWGADAILAFNPKYKGFDPYGFKHLVRHYSALVEAVNIPVVPYSQLDDPIPLEVLKHLVGEGLIKHIKYGPHDCAALRRIMDELGDKLYIFAGADTFILRHLLMGVKGISIATAALFPRECSDLVRLVGEGAVDQARDLYRRSIIYWNDIGFYNCWQSVHKIALQLLGIIETAQCLPPLVPAEDFQRDEVRSLLQYLGKI
ncbi:MAG: dihydrodipicolinate synthase family protein [Pseudomonadota bacterium]